MKISSAELINFFRIVYRRLRRFAIGAVLILVIAHVWHSTTQQSRQQLTLHTQQLARMAVQQAAYSATHWLVQQNTEALREVAENLHQQPGILSASIQNQYGQQLAVAGEITSVIGWQERNETEQPLAMVSELTIDDNLIGYLHVVFDYQQLLRQPEQTHLFLTQRGRALLFLAVIAGVLLMAGFNRIRYKKTTP
ncbi:Uncharacterized membrane protein affecting hemolysin expression [Pseudidiomarina planktonica]|uniref:Uncharacterized membrane protein affecting hemolysin expression n=1 Tax=Pseudidiomarina planktonica TaxID=1323738 RepID=A0A1Y6F3W3_9GAMM|nr:AhpA/YtjB family protein [Pseudidiomarina planktonica]RUO64924.1 hypothetical protein CWI77_00045 [Pseudidiomarina planktonica]SMQ69437.1 Uncharacterized membrane protein affecting hemolysin expression [Pseudidiomarina planktonica]